MPEAIGLKAVLDMWVGCSLVGPAVGSHFVLMLSDVRMTTGFSNFMAKVFLSFSMMSLTLWYLYSGLLRAQIILTFFDRIR
jgi:Na+/glutamate symporter